MKLIIAQGNPSASYATTRHNVGFGVIDSYAASHHVEFQSKDKFKADVAELTVNDEKVLLVKPQTFYNDTGMSARAIIDFYKIDPSDVLIIHDELALPFGTIRTRIGGSDAGNNGVKSINQHVGLGTSRIRIGVYNELRDKMDDAQFVLSKFSADERGVLTEKLPTLKKLIDSFVSNKFEPTTHL